jgi:general nucleoside transport system permease protein
VLNLGAEGMMLVAPSPASPRPSHRQRHRAFIAGGRRRLLAAAFGALVIWLNTNQYATGLALSLFGYGFSAFVGVGYVGQKLAERTPFEVPVLGEIPFIGPALFRQHPMVYIAIAAAHRRGVPGSCTAAAPGWCCARWASRPSRRMRWATRCAGSGCWR